MTGTRLTATVVDRILIGACASDQLLVSPDGGRLYVPTQDPCAIFVIDTSNGAGVARIDLPTFGGHWGGYDDETEAAVVHDDDENNNRHRARQASFIHSDRQLLVATDAKDSGSRTIWTPGICVIDLGKLTVARAFLAGAYTDIARPVSGHDRGQVFLLSYHDGTGQVVVTSIDIRGESREPSYLCDSAAWPGRPMLSPDDRRLYVNGYLDKGGTARVPGVLVFDTTTCDLVATVENVDCWELMVSVDGTRLYCVVVAEDNAGIEGIIVIDTTGFRVQRVIEFELPAPARDLGEGYVAMPGLAQSMDGNRLYCWMVKDGEQHLAIIDPRMGQVIHSARIDMDPSTPVLSDALGVVILCDLEQGSVSIHHAETLAHVASVQLEGDARLPVLAPTGDRMYVSHVDSEWIDVIEVAVPPEPDFTPRDALEERRQRRIPLELPT